MSPQARSKTEVNRRAQYREPDCIRGVGPTRVWKASGVVPRTFLERLVEFPDGVVTQLGVNFQQAEGERRETFS